MASSLKPRVTFRSLAITLVVVLAACGNTPSGETTVSSPTDTTDETTPIVDTNDLSDTCVSPIVVQTDWYPQAEHGGIYELLGSD